MKLLIIEILFYVIIGIFCFMGYKELYHLSKFRFKFDTKTFIGLVYIFTAIGMLITHSWVPMFAGSFIALLARLSLALDLIIMRNKH